MDAGSLQLSTVNPRSRMRVISVNGETFIERVPNKLKKKPPPPKEVGVTSPTTTISSPKSATSTLANRHTSAVGVDDRSSRSRSHSAEERLRSKERRSASTSSASLPAREVHTFPRPSAHRYASLDTHDFPKNESASSPRPSTSRHGSEVKVSPNNKAEDPPANSHRRTRSLGRERERAVESKPPSSPIGSSRPGSASAPHSPRAARIPKDRPDLWNTDPFNHPRYQYRGGVITDPAYISSGFLAAIQQKSGSQSMPNSPQPRARPPKPDNG